MRTSITVIAYNEEKNIKRCLDSLMLQSQKADEIVVVAHNCSDKTEDIIKKYPPPVKLVSYKGPAGLIYARIKAFESASGDYIASIDADSYTHKNWLKNLIKPLQNPEISGTGGVVFLRDSLDGLLLTLFFFYVFRFLSPRGWYFWGSNFACRKSDYLKIGGLEPFIKLKDELKLTRWADDVYLSQKLKQLGKLVFAPKAKVYSRSTESKTDSSEPPRKNWADRNKIMKYLNRSAHS
jgi:glycosyltransferase involved in cell wall biosynthesis